MTLPHLTNYSGDSHNSMDGKHMRLVAVITTLTVFSNGWTMAHVILTLHPRRLVRHARS